MLLNVIKTHFCIPVLASADARRRSPAPCNVHRCCPVEPWAWPRQLSTRQETRQLLDRILDSYSTATRQDSSTATRQTSTDLDRPRQNPPDCMRRGVKVSSSTARQTSKDLDRLTTDLDRAEPIRTSLFECLAAIFSVPQKEQLAWGSHS